MSIEQDKLEQAASETLDSVVTEVKNKKATESALGELHLAVSTVLMAQVNHQVDEMTYNEMGEEVPTGRKLYTAKPATIAAAIKFLKDNRITRDEEIQQGVNDLREALAAKQKHSRLVKVQ